MHRFLLAATVTLAVIIGASPSHLSAQTHDQRAETERPPAGSEEERLAELLTENLQVSRLPEIYADLRYSFRELYLPYLKQSLAEGNLPKFDENAEERIRALVPVIEYSLKAADELDPVLAEQQSAIFADMAALMAKYMTEDEIRLAAEMLRTPAARKGFNTLYAASRLITGYDLNDLRQSQELSRWMADLEFDSDNNPFANKDVPPPPRERVLKAEAVVADILRISRIDDMVSEITRFVRQVVLQVDTLSEEERADIQVGLQQFEFSYNLGKSMVMAVAPSSLAATLDDEQLRKFHLLILSPVMAKSFGLFHDVVRQATSFTKQDLQEFNALAEEAEKHRSSIDPDAKRLMQEEWAALAKSWRERLQARLSPETRTGLEESIADFEALIAEQKRGYHRRAKPHDPSEQEREL